MKQLYYYNNIRLIVTEENKMKIFKKILLITLLPIIFVAMIFAVKMFGTEKSIDGKDQEHIQKYIDGKDGEHIQKYIDGAYYFDGIVIINKSYPASENYAPEQSPVAQNAFEKMKNAAAKDSISLNIVSGYRTFDYQKQLYQKYVERDGKQLADTYSARPGYSEHQTGLTFDLNNASDDFAGTKEAQWIAENCYKFGFIVRYPADKVDITGYEYEPWHVRYVGKELAKYLYDNNLCLEEYFGIDSCYKD